MASISGPEFRQLTYKKIRTVKHLIKIKEWSLAAYIMGYVLECALKAASCKALHLKEYPPIKSKGDEGWGFKTHEFEQLLIVSGLIDLFGSLGISAPYSNWSAFTSSFPGNWTSMRYSETDKFDENSVKKLSQNLYDDPNSIIETIKRNRRW